MRLGDAREVGSSWEVLADQAVGVFVAAALPGTPRVAEVDLHVGGDRKALVGMHLLALVPRQRTSQLLRQFADLLGKRRNDRRRVLARKLDQHREAACGAQSLMAAFNGDSIDVDEPLVVETTDLCDLN